MISAKEMKLVIEYMFSGTPGFISPTSVFTSSPVSYTTSSVPSSVVLSGTITPNGGTITSWSISDSTSTVIAGGTNSVPSYTLTGGSIPTSVSLNSYFLTTYYTDSNGTALSYVVSTSFSVDTSILVGQLSTGTDISVPADLSSGIESTLTTTTQQNIINLFDIVASTTGRVIFVIPDSIGVVTDISDNTNSSVLTQFNIVIDSSNNRKIYTQINQVTPALYKFKISF